MKSICHKQLIYLFTFFGVMGVCGDAFSATVEIQNSIAPIQIGATIYDNEGAPGNPTINLWYPGGPSVGVTVLPGKIYQYQPALSPGASVNFGVQVNAARIPMGGGQCDQLCNHIQVNIANEGNTCTAVNAAGTCGSNHNSPRWSAGLSAQMTGGVCMVTLQRAITPPIVCSCKGGKYPCQNSVQCGSGTKQLSCPAQPPYQW